MKLAYQAFDKAGARVASVIEAADARDAMEQLHRMDLYVAELKPQEEGGPASRWRHCLPRGRMRRLRETAMFTRRLYALIRSGTPITQCLQALERQAPDPVWRAMILDIRRRLEGGSPLSEALGAHGEYFDPVYKAMVAAGESSGKLSIILDRLATLGRKQVHVLGSIRSAMVYPALLAVVGSGVLAAMLLFVVPRFADLFANIGAPLPPTTRFLVSLSEGIRTWWWAVLGTLLMAGGGVRAFLKSAFGRKTVDTFALRLPRVGEVIKSFLTARLARLLGMLVDSHLPIQEILRLARGTSSNYHYTTLLGKAEEAVGRGEPISTAFRDSDLISPSVYEAIRSGEQSGQVSGMLLDLADFLDEENDVTLKSLTSVVEPVLLVLMGCVVGFVVVSIFLPLFDVTGMVSGGGNP